MNSKNQQAAIRYLLENGEATPRELADALGVTSKKNNLIQNMQRYGRLSREGKKSALQNQPSNARPSRKALRCRSAAVTGKGIRYIKFLGVAGEPVTEFKEFKWKPY
ncbi:hypothetical protein BIA58_20060 [Salmonella enterica]|nr:hypothetical protein [Salmonella enterica]EBH7934125.1 hypothetical protein [Salmonella enterica subsp. enterica serovar Rubislaw]